MKRIIENGKTVGYVYKGWEFYRIGFTLRRGRGWMLFDMASPSIYYADTLAQARARIDYNTKEVAKNETN